MNAPIILKNNGNTFAEREDWLTDLNYFEVKIRIAEMTLGSLSLRHAGNQDVMPGIEHFQNQFIVQKHNINQLKAKVRRFWALADNLKLADRNMGGKYLHKLESELTRFDETFNELMEEFNRFNDSSG